MSLNSVILQGRLGRDPELRHTQSGTEVCNFSMAVDNGFGDKKKTVWPDITAWGLTATFVQKYLQKGSECLVEGRLDTEEWEDKETGQKRRKTIVVANRVHFCGSKSDNQSAHRDNATPYIPPEKGDQSDGFNNDDIPF